ncbi:ABC transporter ATP-binding protein [Sphingobacterium yanglingense]|uniref:ABC-type multidrug transport system ATPase subunit n=1 Tax=Sphingobacterium yanglingense TaxID=1437280 RepID=A0A4R6W4Q3_9SPHI|nr:ABC transporter ATP-binding protein [Sphingobacterium yanglingense]TDQ73677.1 ABC-type multidrug transport system ATPase subunit [Sphingobacterium yanglingense]
MSLKINQLTKTYSNGVRALDGIDLEIGVGMFGLLGPNGAGKSSLMRTIATLQSADNGSILFDGMDIFANQMDFRKVLGYLPQDFGVYPNLSAEELLSYFAQLKGISSAADRKKIVNEVLEVTNLYAVRKKNVSGYSGGMKQRFGIAQLLLNKPKLIIVDEPTAGLDPAERHRFLNVLREIGTSNTVIFSTHIVDDVRELCHELAIVNGGRVLYRGTAQAGEEALEGKIWSTVILRDDYEAVSKEQNVIFANYNPDNTLNVRVYSEVSPGENFSMAKPILEDVYFVSLKNDTAHV